jgi:excisionase family DNA binding protein
MMYRLDPSVLNDPELDLNDVQVTEDVQPYVVRSGHQQVRLPKAVFDVFEHVVNSLKRGKGVLVITDDEVYTTQAAANYLGVSRQHIVDILKKELIPYHMVGSHRRIYFKDLYAYAQMRDRNNVEAINSLYKMIDQAGLYDVIDVTDDE